VFGERSSVGERARIVANLEYLDMDLTREAANGLTFWPRVVAPDVEKLCNPNERRSRERGQQKEKTVSGCRDCQQPLDVKMCKCGTNVQRTDALARKPCRYIPPKLASYASLEAQMHLQRLARLQTNNPHQTHGEWSIGVASFASNYFGITVFHRKSSRTAKEVNLPRRKD
jgi:hypothetical protein